ncbi:MAG: hypothetical protein M1837_006435 [Sclerophora amabilis]|nr:MAG: hypothetical protein M1837_006435 [Sclerophora amabilis]
MSAIYRFLGVETPFDPSHRFVTSWLLSPWVLFAVRAVISLYTFTSTFYILAYQGLSSPSKNAGTTFSFFTSLTYWGIAFYTFFAAIHTFSYAKTGRPLLSKWPRPLQALHSIFYTTIVTYPFLVTVVFWALLYDTYVFSSRYSTWSNISQHGLNSLFALSELVLPRTSPPPLLHLLILLVLLALYVGLAYLTHATQGFYPYAFLDPSTGGQGRVTAYAFGILAAIIVIFIVVWGLIWLRRWLTERVARREGVFSTADTFRPTTYPEGRMTDVEVAMAEK